MGMARKSNVATWQNGQALAYASQLQSLKTENRRPPAPGLVIEDLKRWHKKLLRRVEEIESEGGSMGRTEGAKWAEELDRFRGEFL